MPSEGADRGEGVGGNGVPETAAPNAVFREPVYPADGKSLRCAGNWADGSAVNWADGSAVADLRRAD